MESNPVIKQFRLMEPIAFPTEGGSKDTVSCPECGQTEGLLLTQHLHGLTLTCGNGHNWQDYGLNDQANWLIKHLEQTSEPGDALA